MEHSITCPSECVFTYEDVKEAQMLAERGVFFFFVCFFLFFPILWGLRRGLAEAELWEAQHEVGCVEPGAL